MSEHSLKILPPYFAAVAEGRKPFEVRKDDRGFQVGDVLVLSEWTPEQGYTGAMMGQRVTYIYRGEAGGLQEGYVVMGLTDVGLRYCEEEESFEWIDGVWHCRWKDAVVAYEVANGWAASSIATAAFNAGRRYERRQR